MNKVTDLSARLESRDAWRPFSSLYGFVRLVLLVDWDPIGILGIPGAMDEYDSYAYDVCKIIESGASADGIAAHLNEIERTRMSMRGDRNETRTAALKLYALHQFRLQMEHLTSD